MPSYRLAPDALRRGLKAYHQEAALDFGRTHMFRSPVRVSPDGTVSADTEEVLHEAVTTLVSAAFTGIDISCIARREQGRLDDRKRLELWTQLLMALPLIKMTWSSGACLRRYVTACHRLAKAWRAASDKCITAGSIPAQERLGSWSWREVAEHADALAGVKR